MTQYQSKISCSSAVVTVCASRLRLDVLIGRLSRPLHDNIKPGNCAPINGHIWFNYESLVLLGLDYIYLGKPGNEGAQNA
jgi:hypothetical protein